jgi:hypothetical protein
MILTIIDLTLNITLWSGHLIYKLIFGSPKTESQKMIEYLEYRETELKEKINNLEKKINDNI